jgi:hypothetical protein
MHQDKLFALLPLSKRDRATVLQARYCEKYELTKMRSTTTQLDKKLEQQPDVDAWQARAEDGVRLVRRLHVTKATVEPDGAPLQLVYDDATPFGEVRERVRRRLGIAPAEFVAWRFAAIPNAWCTVSSMSVIAEDEHAAAATAATNDTGSVLMNECDYDTRACFNHPHR